MLDYPVEVIMSESKYTAAEMLAYLDARRDASDSEHEGEMLIAIREVVAEFHEVAA